MFRQPQILFLALCFSFSCAKVDSHGHLPLARNLQQARDIALTRFQKLQDFRLDSSIEGELAGKPLSRMEFAFRQEEQSFRGIIHLVEQDGFFNLIYFVSPADDCFFQTGLVAFQAVMRSLKFITAEEELSLEPADGARILKSGDLGLEIRLPQGWTYLIDREARTLVLSGPPERASHLTTINFSVIEKWPKVQSSS